jgi:hypothetical protein
MADNSLLFTLDRFSGMNNVEESFRIPATTDKSWHKLFDMDALENLDIDNSYVLSTRPGSDLELAGTDIHSLWSDGETCLFVDSPTLYKMNLQYTAMSIGTVGMGRMSYATWNDRIYMTNDSYIGYLHDNALTVLADPGITYKLPLPAGRFIAYYRARLYVAKGKVLYISDALCDHYDIRTGFRVFANDITMLIAVEKGLYVSDGVTWFVFGAEPDEFQKKQILDSDAIPYTAVSINGKIMGDGIPGECVLWTSTDGICLGDSDGTVKNLTRSRYAMSEHAVGGAVVRNLNETVHYITVLQ